MTPKPWEGTHGFKGAALLAWERQRLAQRQLLDHDSWRTSSDAKERGGYVMLVAARRACLCPKSFGPGGTVEGEKWVALFNGWPKKSANLSGAYLSGANLFGADLGDWKRGSDGYAKRKEAEP